MNSKTLALFLFSISISQIGHAGRLHTLVEKGDIDDIEAYIILRDETIKNFINQENEAGFTPLTIAIMNALQTAPDNQNWMNIVYLLEGNGAVATDAQHEQIAQLEIQAYEQLPPPRAFSPPPRAFSPPPTAMTPTRLAKIDSQIGKITRKLERTMRGLPDITQASLKELKPKKHTPTSPKGLREIEEEGEDIDGSKEDISGKNFFGQFGNDRSPPPGGAACGSY